jgi:hypothetical protein
MTGPRRILCVVLCIVVAMAILDSLLFSSAQSPGPLDLVWSLAFSICTFAWVKADCREREAKVPAGSALLAAAIIPLGVPIYLFRALGMRRGLWGSLKALGFIAVAALLYMGIALGIGALGWSAHVA